MPIFDCCKRQYKNLYGGNNKTTITTTTKTNINDIKPLSAVYQNETLTKEQNITTTTTTTTTTQKQYK